MQHSPCILLVENDLSQRDFCEKVLASLGYKVRSVDEARRAVELVQSGDFDLVIAEVLLAGQAGTSVADLHCQLKAKCRVLLTSQWVDPQLTDYPLLRKPFSEKELAAKVRQILNNST